jgi:hypothetical protein
MTNIEILTLSIILSLHTIGSLLSIIIGIYIAKRQSGIEMPINYRSANVQAKDLLSNKKLNIDETKVVLNIDTTQMEKKFTNIAEQKTVETDISESVNKLKQMKG